MNHDITIPNAYFTALLRVYFAAASAMDEPPESAAARRHLTDALPDVREHIDRNAERARAIVAQPTTH